jgi:hypothetical protein
LLQVAGASYTYECSQLFNLAASNNSSTLLFFQKDKINRLDGINCRECLQIMIDNRYKNAKKN